MSTTKLLAENGLVIVPIEATYKMMDAGVAAACKALPPLEPNQVGYCQIRAAWDAMIAECNKGDSK